MKSIFFLECGVIAASYDREGIWTGTKYGHLVSLVSS